VEEENIRKKGNLRLITEENPSVSEKEPRNLEKVQNQKHTEAKILKLGKPVRIIVVNGGSV